MSERQSTPPWPVGCTHPDGCERRRVCGYMGCRHERRDIAVEVDAAVAAAQGQEPPALAAFRLWAADVLRRHS